MPSKESAASRVPGVTLVLGALAVVVALVPRLEIGLQFDRLAIEHQEYWRLVTGHWTHASLEHLVWDVLSFLLLGALCERNCRRRFAITVGASVATISASVWIFQPDLAFYRGLSGLDSALFALLAVSMLREKITSRSRFGVVAIAALLAAFAAKVGYEFVSGTTLFVSHTGFVPVPLAHAVGGAVGVLVGMLPVGPAGHGMERDFSGSRAPCSADAGGSPASLHSGAKWYHPVFRRVQA